MESQQPDHPFCQLPGDPSLIITTNVDLGSAKLDVMKGMVVAEFHLKVFKTETFYKIVLPSYFIITL